MQNKQANILSIFRKVDGIAVLLYAILVFMGWFNIYAAVLNEDSSGIFDISYKYGKQAIWMIAAFIIAISFLLIDSKFFSFLAYPLYIFVLLLLIAVIFTPATKGQSSWFSIGDFKIQPAEFAKIAVALVLSKYMSGYNIKITQFKHIRTIAAIFGIPIILILLQPDVGTILIFGGFLFVLYREGMPGWILLAVLCAVVLFIVSFMFGSLAVSITILSSIIIISFFAFKYHKLSFSPLFIGILALGLPWFIPYMFSVELAGFLLFMIGFGILIIPLIIYSYRKKIKTVIILFVIAFSSISFSYSVDYIFHTVFEAHHRTRINVLFGLESDPQGVEFNVIQSKIAIGSGGLTGKGYLQGTQTKHDFVPEQSTDFIFCTVGEEWGFVGVSVVLILFVLLFLRIIYLAEQQRSIFSRVFGYSVASILFMHFLINIGMTVGLMPVIGIPLPFFSYGGSSLWAFTIFLFIFLKLDTDRDVLVF